MAFDHFTLSDDPRQNVQWLIDNMPDGTNLTVDIVCHSRGGLVARTLAEQISSFRLGSKRINVDRIIFVAVPNAGTALTDGVCAEKSLDLYTVSYKTAARTIIRVAQR